MGNLYTTSDGSIMTGLTSGFLELDFTVGQATAPDGTITEMNTSLQTMSKEQCKSITVFCSDADAVIFVGNALTISDHKLLHTIHNYDFDHVRVQIPNNSTPDANQVMFMASDDQYLNYEMQSFFHDRAVITGTSTNTEANYYTKHIGGYDDMYVTIYNTGGSNSINVKIYYSEDGTTFFADQDYTSFVTIAAGSYNSFASSRKHHFIRAQILSTVTDSHSTFTIYYNNVSANT